MKKKLTGIVLLLSGFFIVQLFTGLISSVAEQNNIPEQRLATAYAHRQNNVQVGGRGIVLKILRDDRKGSRHQRFILKLASGQTILISHNIDIAPRIATLQKGDIVEFYGEYAWNKKGGVVHWTHHDPKGRHANGWLKHRGTTYQ